MSDITTEEPAGTALVPARRHYRTVGISDVHIGATHSKVEEASAFLESVTCDLLILNGDIIDGWQLDRHSRRWKHSYTKFFDAVMRMMDENDTEVVYLRGNHDDFLDNIAPLHLANISIVKDYILETGGKRYFITHGDVFDSVTSNMRWLSVLGDKGYNMLLWANAAYNRYRLRRGKPYYSLSQTIKHKVKQAVSFISGFEKMLADLARSKKCDGVICGHIHYPEDRMIDGVRYLNSGDWVESLSALVEEDDGTWRIMRFRYEYENKYLEMQKK